ncbi:MAG: orotidine-5'-phosphate decarboxylase [Planctomycetota bacterium]|nr:orotidine-5'-phosphate decarboxylase [Planctomycetota bacterium]
MPSVFAHIAELVTEKRSPLVLGLDPRSERMPHGYVGNEGVVRFHSRLIELVADHVVAVKPQIAFFEQLGEDGLWVYAETCRLARQAGLVVIGDIKRGDIGSTAEAYAEAHFRWADVVTVNPYLGDDSLEPFFARCRDDTKEGGKGVFVLCATSNPGWRRFQTVEDRDGRPLYLSVAAAIAEWNDELRGGDVWGPVGAVVGATHPEVLASVRRATRHSWLLVPGVGAQGARMQDLKHAFDADGHGALVPVSRGLASCFEPSDVGWEKRVRDAAEMLVAEARSVVLDG